MQILSIETSCDETAISLLEIKGGQKPVFSVLGNEVASQIKLHEQYGGVFPMMAKREHAKNIFPLFLRVLKEAKIIRQNSKPIQLKNVETILAREPELLPYFLHEIPKIARPKIDAIAVTVGPGLEPALWVGINFAKALATVWDIPLIPVNHMEGHALSVLIQEKSKKFLMTKDVFPAISLLVSGGHTELVLINAIGKYKIIGRTRDDAAGEAFDKVARMLGLPYPGGPQISKLASKIKQSKISLPRPMIHSKDFDFSFSGLKTAVLYTIRDIKNMTELIKTEIAHEFQNAVIDVLKSKTFRALEVYKAKTLIVGGGVAANKALRQRFATEAKNKKISLYFPTKDLTTDNSIMIGIAGYFQFLKKNKKGVRINSNAFQAKGNLSF